MTAVTVHRVAPGQYRCTPAEAGFAPGRWPAEVSVRVGGRLRRLVRRRIERRNLLVVGAAYAAEGVWLDVREGS